jgi:hypothetical protein
MEQNDRSAEENLQRFRLVSGLWHGSESPSPLDELLEQDRVEGRERYLHLLLSHLSPKQRECILAWANGTKDLFVERHDDTSRAFDTRVCRVRKVLRDLGETLPPPPDLLDRPGPEV